MDDNDPINLFFPGQESVDLYEVLSLDKTAQPDNIKRAYRRLALRYHPDKLSTADEDTKKDASIKFQQIGFAYAVLSDAKRRARYDTTGGTDEGLGLDSGSDGWEAYFEDLFERVTRGKLDEMKKEYQGSSEERADLKAAYLDTSGKIEEIMTFIPHSTQEDEERFIVIINEMISQGDLSSTKAWKTSIKDDKGKAERKKKSKKEAKEAEALAKEIGVWDEFYGSGKPGDRKSKSKAKDGEEADVSALQALILKKKQKNVDGFLDSLVSKYADSPSKKSKGKKRAHDAAELGSGEEPSTKKVNAAPEINDEDFAKLQERLFGGKQGSSNPTTKKQGKRRK